MIPPSAGPLGPRRRQCLVVFAAAGGSLAGGCALRGPLRIGFIGGLSGRVADLGIGGRNGAQLAVEDANRAGGVGGRELELLVRDDEQDADTARQRFGELADAGARLVVGPMTSSVAVAIAPLAAARGVPLISPTATTHEMTGRADAFFRLVPDTAAGAQQQAERLWQRGARSLVTLADHNNRAFASSWVEAAGRRFEGAGGRVVGNLSFQAGPGLRFVELARHVVASGADSVLIAASAADSAVLVQQIRRLGAAPMVALSSWAGTEQLPQLGGPSLDGVIVAQYFDRASTAPRFRSFDERYRQRFGEPPGYPAVNAHDAVGLGVRALATAGEGRLLATLAGLRTHDGLQRRVELDEYGDSRSPIFHAEIRGGVYVALAS